MTRRTLYVQLIIAFMCVAMVAYLVMLGRVAVAMIGSGRAAAAGLGLALLILPVIGLWAMIATLRAGFAYQRLAPSDRRRRTGHRRQRAAPPGFWPHSARRGRCVVRCRAHRARRRRRRLAPLVPTGARLRLRGGSAPRAGSDEDGPTARGAR